MCKVSVIVPVYNTSKYLDKCIDSIVNQTLNDIEILIVNDGSTDNSQDIIDKYTKKYDIIKSYIKENGGLSDTRNYGIERSNGEYIAFIDSDDYIKADMLEKMYNKVKKESLDIVVCDSINVYEDGREILIRSNKNYSDNVIKNYLLAPPMACIRLISRKLIDNVKFKKGIYYEDLELMPKLVKYTDKIGFIDEGYYYYYQRSGSIMKVKKFNNRLLDIFSVLEGNYDVLYNDYPEEIEYMYISHLLRTASLRFLNYDNYNIYIDKICDIIRKNFPYWKKNIYYKNSSIKLKIICNLVYYRRIYLLRLIKKVTNH